jgi:UDP-N-acetylmuramoyl-tripeptide--D-alanyl-D-alanine ligase
MKKIFVKILKWVLKNLARLTIKRYKPKIVGITGSVGKTSTKIACATVLSKKFKLRSSYGNLNNELGLPLTILGDWSEQDLNLVSRNTPQGKKRIQKLSFWTKVILKSVFQIIFKNKNYPQVLILEYGADRPGDIRYLLNIARPDIGIITAIGEIPVHVEFYSSSEEVALEKSGLIMNIPAYSYVILNYDDDTVMNIKHRTRAHILTFGFDDEADVQIINFENKIENNKPLGIVFKIKYENNIVPVSIFGAFGKSHAYACACACALGLVFEMNLIEIAEALESYKPEKGRANLLEGIKNSLIIDDSYNASFLSMANALDLLKSLPAKRKIAVLGDMLEIGKYSIFAHENIGKIAGKVCDLLITIGPRAKFIAEGAKSNGLKQKNILSFNTVDEAKEELIKLIKPGDLVLLKASHAMGLHQLVDYLKFFEISNSNNKL